MKLEDISVTSSIKGILPSGPVTVVAVESVSSDSVKVAFIDSVTGRQERVLSREDEASLTLATRPAGAAVVGVAPKPSREGLTFARLLMVLGGMSPLFILWAIKGIAVVPDKWLWTTCALLVVLPNVFLVWRIRTAKNLREIETKVVGDSEDHRDHLLVYLFAMLLPFYSVDMLAPRALLATVAALAFVVFLFWHLNLHYMNILFAIGGYRIFTVYTPQDGNPLSGKGAFVVITQRTALAPGEELTLYRLSGTVFFEEKR